MTQEERENLVKGIWELNWFTLNSILDTILSSAGCRISEADKTDRNKSLFRAMEFFNTFAGSDILK